MKDILFTMYYILYTLQKLWKKRENIKSKRKVGYKGNSRQKSGRLQLKERGLTLMSSWYAIVLLYTN
jgi:hypothetical protein